jgi:uncharacterized membrane protein YeaQ/YmgE (transglycosylase-associated protein family)
VKRDADRGDTVRVFHEADGSESGGFVVGIVGAFLAGWLLPSLGLGIPGILGAIVYAAIGAIILLVLIGFIKRA